MKKKRGYRPFTMPKPESNATVKKARRGSKPPVMPRNNNPPLGGAKKVNKDTKSSQKRGRNPASSMTTDAFEKKYGDAEI